MFVDLPFIPQAGTYLKVTPEGEFMTVQSVMVDITANGSPIIISMEEPDEITQLRPWKEMIAQGWKPTTIDLIDESA